MVARAAVAFWEELVQELEYLVKDLPVVTWRQLMAIAAAAAAAHQALATQLPTPEAQEP